MRDEAVQALQHTAGFLRTALSHRLQLYSVPQLHFAYDDSIESGMRLSQLIDDAVAADRKPAALMAYGPRSPVPARAPAGRRRAAARQARPAFRRTRRCSARSACYARKRPVTPERSIRSLSGLLPLCFGDATKFAQVLLDARKEYVATVRFGIATTTGDAEGEGHRAVRRCDFAAPSSRRRCRDSSAGSTQVPPRHAALKFEGRALLRVRARRRRDSARSARDRDRRDRARSTGRRPDAMLRVACSKGTYIRVLAEDIGARARQPARISRRCAGPPPDPCARRSR